MAVGAKLAAEWATLKRASASSPRSALAIDAAIASALFGGTFLYRQFYNFDTSIGDWPDVQTYLTAGMQLLRGEHMEATNVMPLFPLLFATVGADGIEQINTGFHGLTSAAVYVMARALLDARFPALLAGIATLVSPLMIFYSNLKLTEVMYTCLLSLGLMCIVCKRAMPAALFLVLGTLVRPVADLIAPLLMLFAAKKRAWPSLARPIALYFLVYLALMSPWWVHNYERFGQFVQLNLGSGAVARLENSEHFSNTGFDHATMYDGLQPYYQISDPIERDQAMRHDAIEWAARNPIKFFYFSFDRMGRFFELKSHYNRAYDLWFLTFTTFIYFLAVTFIFTARLSLHRKFLPLYITFLFVAALTIATHSMQRYRLPVEPILYIMAAGGLALLCERWVLFAWRPIRALAEERFRKASVNE